MIKLYESVWEDKEKDIYCYISDMGLIIDCHGNSDGTIRDYEFICRTLAEHKQGINQILFVCCFPAQVAGNYPVTVNDNDYDGIVWAGVHKGYLITAHDYSDYLYQESVISE